MKNPEATIHVLRKRVAPYLLVALLGTFPATSALAEIVEGDLIVKGAACIGTECTSATYPFDALRIHGPTPLLSMVDESDDDGPSHDWSMGLINEGGASDFFIRDDTYDAQVLRITADGAVALGAGAAIVDNAISVGAVGHERRVAHVANAVDDTDAVNLQQFEAFQSRALDSVGGDEAKLKQQLADIIDRIEDMDKRIKNLSRRLQ